jgi:4-amino-4-deoxy-L-arabinose transferase-like glycosyltransferase
MMVENGGEMPARNVGETAGSKPRQVLFGLLMIAVAIASAAVLFPRIGQTEFLCDESGWISSGRYYTNLVLEGDLSRDKWRCDQCAGFGDLNMQVGKWLVGMPVTLDRQSREEAFFRFYDTTASYEENVERGLVPPHHTLMVARSASAVFGVLCCLLVFSIGWYAGNPFVGAVAAGLVLCDSLFIRQATRAMTDIHYVFFLLCFCLAVILLSTASSPKRALFFAGLCGIFTGLACTIKITGLVVGGTSFVLALGQFAWFGLTTKKALIYQLAVFCCSALGVIYGLNPYFWPSPRRLADIAVFGEVKQLSSEVITTRHLPKNLKDRFPHIGTLGWPLQFPRLFTRWNNRMQGQEKLPSARWNEPRPIELTRRVVDELSFFRKGWLFLAIGIVVLLWKRSRQVLSIPDNPGLICLQFFLVNYLFILTFMRVNWDRYYLPTILASSLVLAFGVYAVAFQLYRFYPVLKRRVFSRGNIQH